MVKRPRFLKESGISLRRFVTAFNSISNFLMMSENKIENFNDDAKIVDWETGRIISVEWTYLECVSDVFPYRNLTVFERKFRKDKSAELYITCTYDDSSFVVTNRKACEESPIRELSVSMEKGQPKEIERCAFVPSTRFRVFTNYEDVVRYIESFEWESL